MLEFLIKLQLLGLNIYLSDYYRIRVALATGGEWTIFRLRETLRVLLLRNLDYTEIFDHSFRECFGDDSGIFSQIFDVSQILLELKAPGKFVELKQNTSHPEQRIEKDTVTDLTAEQQQSFVSHPTEEGSVPEKRLRNEVEPTPELQARPKPPNSLQVTSDFSGQREFILKASLPSLCNREFLEAFSDDLGYFLSDEHDELIDMQQTVEETSKRWIPELVFRSKQKNRCVLILEDKSVIDPPVYDFPGELASGLTQQGVPAMLGYFYDSPQPFSIVNDKEYVLEDLEDERNGYLVLIFSDGQGIRPDSHKQLLEDLSQWPYVVWLETRPVNKWDDITRFIGEYIPVYPATLNGLKDSIELVSSEPSKLTHHVIDERSYRLEDFLQDQLPWACACALFQPMDLGVAEQLRQHFFQNLPREAIQALLSLPRTILTNAGLRYSQATVITLLTVLRNRWPEQETSLRLWLDRLLDSNKPKENSMAYLAWQFYRATNLLQIDKERAREGAEILLELEKSLIKNYVFEQFQNFVYSSSSATAGIPLRSIERDTFTISALIKFVAIESFAAQGSRRPGEVNPVSNEQICYCGEWIISPTDQYCGWCGAYLGGYDINFSQETFFLGEEKGKKQIELLIKNTGPIPFSIFEIRTNNDLATIQEPPSNKSPIRIPSYGSTHRIKLVVDFIRAPEKYKEINIYVFSDLKGEEGVRTATLRLMRRPRFDLKTDELRLVFDGKNEKENHFTLILLQGPAEILEIKTDQPWAKVSVLSASLPVEMREHERRELKLRLNINEKMLVEEIVSKSLDHHLLKFHLYVICRGLENKPFDLPLEIPIKLPAILDVREALIAVKDKGARILERRIERTVFLNGRRKYLEFDIPMMNRGDAPLRIDDIKLPETPSWLELQTYYTSKHEIKPEELGRVRLRINSHKLPEGHHRIALQIYCNDPYLENGVASIPVLIEGKMLQDYPGIVAFDFGTTNTRVAVFDPASMTEPEVLILDHISSNRSTSVPSIILYRKLSKDNSRDCIVGRNAKACFGVPGMEESSIVTSIKRRLGQPKPLSIHYCESPEVVSELLPEEIAGDFINEVLAEVEQKLWAKVKYCGISHPVYFKHRRIEALERAFKLADVEVEEKIAEPLAAALDYIFRHRSPEKSYNLLVWDFGFSSIDIAYLRINMEKAESGYLDIITPELLAEDSERFFGGNEVTVAILRYFAGICQTEVTAKLGPDFEIVVDFDQIKQVTIRSERETALSNYRALFDSAESAKIEVTNIRLDSAPRTPTLYFWRDGKRVDIFPPPLVLSLQKLEELIQEPVENALARIIDIIEVTGNMLPDVIVMVGQSSRLLFVRSRMEELFGSRDCRIVLENSEQRNTFDHFNESAVVGLCRYLISQHYASDVHVRQLLRSPKATSHIGIRKYSGGKLIFSPIIKKGDTLGKWYKLENVLLDRRSKLSILSHSGRSLDLSNARYIETIAIFPFDNITNKVTDEELKNAEIFLQVSSDEHVLFKVKIGEQESEPFKAEIPVTMD